VGSGDSIQCTVFSIQCTVFSIQRGAAAGRRGDGLRRDAAATVNLKAIGFVGVERLGGAEAAGAEEGFEAGEGVGEFVGIAQGAFEEVALGLAGEGGGELEGPGHHGSGGADGVEVGVEEAEEGGGVAGGFGEAEVAEVEVAVVEGEGETGRDGGALGRGEAGAEGVEAAAQEEEEGFEGFEGVFEFLRDLEVLGRAVESEEAGMLAVQDIVQAGCFGTEAFGEALARESGEIAEVLDTPEMEQVVIERVRGRSVQYTVFSIQKRERKSGESLNTEY